MSEPSELPQSIYKVTEIEIIYRNPVKQTERPLIRHSRDAYDILRQVWDNNKIELLEQFKILLLDQNNKCLGVADIATGGISFCPVDAKVIFATALKAKASSVILAHNHPSGNIHPSQHDWDLTEQLKEAAALIGIRINDHLILTTEWYSSYADGWIMPQKQNSLNEPS
jgi:DNA repair protein RadC